MKTLTTQPNLVEQVRDAILEEIASGQFAPGDRIIQEQIAQALGVSRQPVQQALVLLRNQGVLHDAHGRGLIVAPLDHEHVSHMYDMRAVLEGLACRQAAASNAERAAKLGPALIEAGLVDYGLVVNGEGSQEADCAHRRVASKRSFQRSGGRLCLRAPALGALNANDKSIQEPPERRNKLPRAAQETTCRQAFRRMAPTAGQPALSCRP